MTSGTTSSGRRRRGDRGLRRRLTVALIFTSLVSLVTVGTINFFAAQDLLQEGSRAQLVGGAESRVVSIERGIDGLLARTSSTAADQGVVDALVELTDAAESLEGVELDDEQSETLEGYYRTRVVDPLNELGVDVTLTDVEPTTEIGRYLQYHYTLPARTGEPVSGEDSSSYATALERHDGFLREIVEQGGVEDLLLISTDGRVVYTAQKYVDLGNDLTKGILKGTNLAETGFEDLPRVRVGDSVVADYERYLPGGGRPALFVLAGVKNGVETVGALAYRVPVDGLNAITTAGGQWERIGLGDGETYVVSADKLLLSESRTWIEDPQEYLDKVDDPDLVELIEVFGSPVGLQPVDTRSVRAALAGETFEGQSPNYLGDRNFSYARRVTTDGLDWVVVAEQPVGALRAPLWSYLGRLGIVIAILLPVAGLLGYLLADRLTRSIVPVVEMAGSVVDGERDLGDPDLGANEVGDLARQLDRMARQLGEQEAALAAEFEERRRLLRSVLPARLVDDAGEIGGTGQSVDTATVIALAVDLDLEDADDAEQAESMALVTMAIGSLAEAHDIEIARSSADRHLLVAGLDRSGDGAQAALDFMRAVQSEARQAVEDDVLKVVVSAGLATGTVASGVLERGSLTFGVWGQPVRRALAIGALSASSRVLLDESTVTSVGASGGLEPADEVIALDGRPMTLSALVAD